MTQLTANGYPQINGLPDLLPKWATGDGTPEEPRQLYQAADGKLYTCDTDEPVICSWFVMCEEQATDVEQHPSLGGVPICARCGEKLRG